MGAMVAQTVAVTAPDRVLSLILGGFPPGLDQDQLNQLAPETIPASWDEWGTGYPEAVRQMFMEHNDDFEALRACMAANYQAGATISDLQAAPHPTLVYVGAEDSLADLARQQAEALPGRLELVPGGHVEAFRGTAHVLPLALSHIDAASM
jgi:pimeloyl-ACP methyl ester carboxylesterase